MLDRLLHQLVQAAGKDAAVMVVSAHGVRRHGAAPPRAGRGDNDAWKSPHGIFAACGPGFAEDALVFGATVLDVAPTVLTWFGLPIGDDMEGRVLIEGFAQAPEVARVASWEPAQGLASSRWKLPGSRAQLPGGGQTPARIRLESGTVLSGCGALRRRAADSGATISRLPGAGGTGPGAFPVPIGAAPSSPRPQRHSRWFWKRSPPAIWSLLLRAELCLAKGQTGEARSLVHQARDLHPTHPDAMRRLGMLLLELREWTPLAELAKEALKLDDNEPLAWLGLAEAQLRRRLPAEAEEAALRAIGLNYYLPQAHFVLARALIAQSKWHAARETMQTLLRLQPNNRAAAAYAKRMGQQRDG